MALNFRLDLGLASPPTLAQGVGGVAAPANTAPPAITGTTNLGDLLTCSTGTWTGDPSSYAYQWTRNGSDIVGATSSTYTIVTADTARDLNCRVTATNAGGATAQLAAAVSIPAPELVGNGTFASDTVWTKNAGWTISGGVAVATAAGAFSNITQVEDQFEAGVTYTVSFDIVSLTSGSFRISFAGGTQRNGTTRSAVGTYTEDMVANTGNNLITVFNVAAGTTGTIDNVSVRKKL
ncbi:hypothetical protein [Microcystis phage Mae-JY30]